MAPKLPLLLLLVFLMPAASHAAAAAPFDITKILSAYPEFNAFNSLLTDTGLAGAINGRKVVTVLAINNTAVADALHALPPGLPRPLLAQLLDLHAVLDYLDLERLDALRRGRTGAGSMVTTLLQKTPGAAARVHGAGLLRVAGAESGPITFASAAPGGGRTPNVTLVRVVTSEGFSVLVLQVSGLIVPPGGPTGQLPPRARQMSRPPAPAPAPEPALGTEPLAPPTPNTPPPAPTGVIPIPSVHGGVATKIPPKSAAGHVAASWRSGALGIMACLLWRSL